MVYQARIYYSKRDNLRLDPHDERVTLARADILGRWGEINDDGRRTRDIMDNNRHDLPPWCHIACHSSIRPSMIKFIWLSHVMTLKHCTLTTEAFVDRHILTSGSRIPSRIIKLKMVNIIHKRAGHLHPQNHHLSQLHHYTLDILFISLFFFYYFLFNVVGVRDR
jgi:hypothetical protein